MKNVPKKCAHETELVSRSKPIGNSTRKKFLDTRCGTLNSEKHKLTGTSRSEQKFK